ncbi:MAG: hypothetical protein ACKOFO_00850 [Gemmatimonadota bacterium]
MRRPRPGRGGRCGRALRVARTVADLDGRATVDEAAVAEALMFRPEVAG